MRTIELHLEEEDVPGTDLKAIQQAVGRLATWAIGQFDVVKIYPDGKDDLVAVYSSTTSERKYTIGAVWRGAEYTFHS